MTIIPNDKSKYYKNKGSVLKIKSSYVSSAMRYIGKELLFFGILEYGKVSSDLWLPQWYT